MGPSSPLPPRWRRRPVATCRQRPPLTRPPFEFRRSWGGRGDRAAALLPGLHRHVGAGSNAHASVGASLGAVLGAAAAAAAAGRWWESGCGGTFVLIDDCVATEGPGRGPCAREGRAAAGARGPVWVSRAFPCGWVLSQPGFRNVPRMRGQPSGRLVMRRPRLLSTAAAARGRPRA